MTDVGAYTGSASPYGTFDQGGNVFEWNEQNVDDAFRGIRGGSWRDSARASAISLSASDPQILGVPSGESDYIGFRVASRLVPSPERPCC